LQLRNTVNNKRTATHGDQYLHQYVTYIDDSNYERVNFGYVAGVFNVAYEIAGTGIARNLAIDGVHIKCASTGFPSSIAIGNGATASSSAGTSIGINASSVASGGTSLGHTASAAGSGVAVGNNSTATGGTGAMCLGSGSAATGNASIALGIQSVSGANCLAVGCPTSAAFAIGNVYFGSGMTSAAPVSTIVQASGGVGTDIDGATLTLAGGKPTGAGIGGSIVFSTAVANVTGTTLRSLQQRWKIDQTGLLAPATDNLLDLGAVGARVRTVYVGTSVEAPRVRTTTLTVATLPTAATAGAGARAYVSDATLPAAGNYGGAVVGGGANGVPVWTNGAAWFIG
jgi:hypothetical protein